MKYGLSQKQLQDIKTILAAWPDIESAWLFGSRALGSYKEASDIDLAIKGRLDHKTLIRLKDAFEESDLPFFVDLVEYADITEPALKKHIDDHGVCIYGENNQIHQRRELPLGDLINLKRGYDLPTQSRIFGKVPIISSSGISGYHSRKMVEGPGVIAGRYGTIGQVFYSKDAYWPLNTALYVQDFKGNSTKFVYYYLQQLDWEKFSDKSAVPGVNRNNILQELVSFPLLDEQKAIAAVLSSLDDKIDLLHRQNKTLEAMAETLFRQWFVEDVQEGWDERPLSGIANFLNGLACQKYPPTNDLEKLPVLKIRELSSGISETADWATSQVKPEFIVTAGDVIFAWSASLMVKVWDGGKCVLNQHLFKVTSEEFPKWFYLMWCKHHLAEFIAVAASHATTMGHIKRGDLDAAMVLVPPPNLIDGMTRQMQPLLDKQIANAKQRKSLGKLRDTLLPKLMSGEVRVTH